MVWLPCPYLGKEVELTAERERHILEAHPTLLPSVRERVADVLADPDEVRIRSWRRSQIMFVRRTEEGDMAVVVTSDDEQLDDENPPRSWVVTAFRTPEVPLSELLWLKP